MIDMVSILADRVQNAIVTALNDVFDSRVELAVRSNLCRSLTNSENLVNNTELSDLDDSPGFFEEE